MSSPGKSFEPRVGPRRARTCAMLMLAFSVAGLSQGGGGFDLNWTTIDGGGGTSSGGDFVLSGTIGQPDAGDLAGGDFVLRGGYWQPGASGGCGDCPTDVDGDGDVNAFDLANLLGAWGPVTPASACLDADGNGFIEAFDLAVLLGAWGPC